MDKYPLRRHDGLSWFKDGDALCIVRKDFVDLQTSPAVFPKCSCGSSNIIPPAECYPKFTCESCGREIMPNLLALTRKV